MRKILSNEKGSVIMIGMITSVVVAIVSLAVIEYVLNYKQYAEITVHQGDFNSLNAQIYSIIQQEPSCRRAIGGALTFGSPALIQPQTFAPPFAVNEERNIVLYYPGPSAPLTVFAGNNSTFGRLSGITLKIHIDKTPTDPMPNSVFGEPNTYFAHLEIGTNIPKGMQLKYLTGSSDLFITFHVNAANQIDTCNGLTFIGNGGVIQGLPNCPAGDRIYSDGDTIYCRTAICPVGMTRTGWSPSGNAICM